MKNLIDGFLYPEDEFSPFPFWFLNGDLKEEKLEKQLRDFRNKGICGVVLHPRIGIPRTLEYLSDAFMEKIVFAVKTAKKLGMKVLLYDEGMYPSGSAHGRVVKENPDYAAKGIRLLRQGEAPEDDEKILFRLSVEMTGADEYRFSSARVLSAGEEPEDGKTVLSVAFGFTRGTIRGIHEEEDDGQRHAPKAGDLLSAEAMQAFIRHTHEVYYCHMPQEFGDTVIGFFTDEPSPVGRACKKGMIAWTDGFEKEIEEKGFKKEAYPALFLKCGGQENEIRAEYSRHLNERLIRTYYEPLNKWCAKHGVALCGHPHGAQDSGLLNYFQIPGQDVVWRWVAPENDLALSGEQSAQAKCASDIARHIGARRNLNECFGCCGPKGEMWALNVWDMKWYLNWLFVRGCNFIVPHAFFYELDTPVQADRPPDVGPNNIFWEEYPVLSGFIKRMCMLNTDSVNQAKVAVLGTGDRLEVDGVRKLYENQIEFNYLTEECFMNSVFRDGKILIGNQVYEALIVPEGFSFQPAALKKAKTAEKAGVYVTKRADRRVMAYREAFFTGNSRSLRISRLVRNGKDALIVSNEGEKPYKGRMKLPFAGPVTMLNPWSGEVRNVKTQDQTAEIAVRARELVVFTNDTRGQKEEEYHLPLKPVRVLSMDKHFKMRLPGGEWREGLSDWQEIDEIRAFSGEILYCAKVVLRKNPGNIVLDLGDVREKAKVYVNGEYAGVRIAPEYTFDIGALLKKGENRIEVYVTNALVGKYEGRGWPSGILPGTKLRFYE